MRRWEVTNSPGKVLFDLPTKSFLNKKTLGLSPKTFQLYSSAEHVTLEP